MTRSFRSGDPFPDLTLTDDQDREVALSEVANGQPLILALYRGPW